MRARKYALGALFVLIAFFGARVAAVAGPETVESDCPKDFDFENAKAKELSKCVKGFESWIAGLESRLAATEQALATAQASLQKASPKAIVSAGIIRENATVEMWESSTEKVSADQQGAKGQYRVTFTHPHDKEPTVLVGTNRLSGIGSSVVAKVDLNGFTVRCEDKDGPSWGGFWFVVLSP